MYASTVRLGAASAAGALQDYRTERAAVGVTGTAPRVPMPPRITLPVVVAAVTRGLSGLFGPVTHDAIKSALTMVQGSISQLVLDQGRQATIDAATADPKVRGWVRVLSPGACSFCAMLAARPNGYASQSKADFPAHPDCHCIAQPLFEGVMYATQPEVARAEELWAGLPSGLHNADQRLAFRQAWEGRKVTVSSGAASPGTRGGRKGTADEDARTEIRNEAARIAKETDADALTHGLAKARARLSALSQAGAGKGYADRRAKAILRARIDAITTRLGELDHG